MNHSPRRLPSFPAAALAIAIAGALVVGCQQRGAQGAPALAPGTLRAATAKRAPAPEVALGRRLFFEPRLSRTGKVSCASCHDPRQGFSDGRPVSTGVEGRRGTRNSPTVLLAAQSPLLFWDGRAASLEEQALGPIRNPVEMDADVETVVRGLAAEPSYDQQFRAVYGTPPSETTLAKAIAAYERALEPGPSPYDRWLDGDTTAISQAAVRGSLLFAHSRCAACHKGQDLTDNKFHNVGWGMDQATPDAGRGAVTGDRADWGKFKTPTLRNLAQSGPYFHDGKAATIEAVVDYYDRGGNPNENLDPRVQPLNLPDDQKADLVAFLRALSGGHNDAALAPAAPRLPR